jgi:hypothetical protein
MISFQPIFTEAVMQHVSSIYTSSIASNTPKYIPPNAISAVENIKKKTRIPVLIPALFKVDSRIPNNAAKANTQWFATQKSYSICFYSFSCIDGEVITEKTLGGSEQFQKLFTYPEGYLCKPKQDRIVNNRSGFITLSRGVKGFYLMPFSLGYCGYPQVIWRQGRYQYSVSTKRGTFEELVKLANSAIDNQP